MQTTRSGIIGLTRASGKKNKNMTEIEASLSDQRYNYFFERSITGINDGGKEYNDTLALASREERIVLLKAGFTGKDIESLYLELNGLVVTCIKWMD